jgi:indolepyruvate ferredoxin oxidoreductase beta subunit
VRKLDFVLVGVGGQGILLAGDILCQVGLAAGYDVKKADVHGMAQRGGSVISHVRLGAKVYSPLVSTGCADFLVALEKVEACRSLHYLGPEGIAVVNDQAIPTLAALSQGGHAAPPYPSDTQVKEWLLAHAHRLLLVPAWQLARELGDVRAANVALLGALSTVLPFAEAAWQEAIAARVPARARELNLLAFARGRQFALAALQPKGDARYATS